MVNEEQILEAVELARKTGKIKKGTNEATKALERGNAKLVVYAKDANPKEIVLHIPLLAKEKNIPVFEVSQKAELGAAAGLEVSTVAVAIIDAGEAKDIILELQAENNNEEKKEDKKTEEAEEKVEEQNNSEEKEEKTNEENKTEKSEETKE